MLKIAMLYASWRDEGEEHSWPIAVHKELLKRGHEIKDFNLYHDRGKLHHKRKTRFYSDEGLNMMYAEIRQNIFVPDVVFQLDYGQHHSNNLDKNNFKNAVWVLEAGDDWQAFRSNFAKAHKFDITLTPHLPCVAVYQQSNINAAWWTQSCDIDYLNEVQDVPIIFDAVSTCGPRGNGLTEKIKEALGDSFAYDRYYYNKDHTKRLKSGKMVFHHSQYKEIGRRIMEGAGCGKLVICDRLSDDTGLSQLFIDGQDIIYYDSAEDAIDKIRYFASHDLEREAIALNGYNKVMANHTVKQRVDTFEQIVEKIRNEN